MRGRCGEPANLDIEFIALHDALTGLSNRAQFNSVVGALVAEPGGQAHALLFIGLDGFKPINDTLGHAAGDEALNAVAGRLRHALAIAGRLLESIGQPMALLGSQSQLGASIGIALLPPHGGRSASEILSAADNAMYAAKRSGKGCAVLADAWE